MKDLMINIAYDKERKIVYASNAVKGKKYYCPKCDQELIFKNSGKTGKGSRRPHFAHRGGGGHNCDPESVLHAAFKNKTAKLLEGYIAENKVFDVKWICKECGTPYSGNLLFVAKSVKVEYDLKECKPDIALLDETGKVRIAVEIVKTHEPEDNATKYYKEHGIILVKYNVVEEDLHRIEDKLKSPDFVSLCIKGSCNAFNRFVCQRELKCVPYICKRCNNQKFALFVEQKTALFNSNGWLEQKDANLITENRLELKFFKYKDIVDPYTGEFISTFVSVCKCDVIKFSPQRIVRRRNWWL